jgi:hypothetical protein
VLKVSAVAVKKPPAKKPPPKTYYHPASTSQVAKNVAHYLATPAKKPTMKQRVKSEKNQQSVMASAFKKPDTKRLNVNKKRPVVQSKLLRKVGKAAVNSKAGTAILYPRGTKREGAFGIAPRTKAPVSPRVVEHAPTRSLTNGQSAANPKNNPIVTPKPVTGMDLFHAARLHPAVPTPGSNGLPHPNASSTKQGLKADDRRKPTKSTKPGSIKPGSTKPHKSTKSKVSTTSISRRLGTGANIPKPDSTANGGLGVTGKPAGTPPASSKSKSGGGTVTIGGGTVAAPASGGTSTSVYNPDTGDTTTTTTSDAARKAFLKKHPVFAKLNAKQQKAWLVRHPAWAKQWSTAKKPTTTKKVTNPLKDRANATVNSEIDPQVAEMNRQSTEETTKGTQAVGSIKQLYGLASTDTEAQRADTQAVSEKATADTQAIYNKLSTDTKKSFEDAAAHTNAENQRLGIVGAQNSTEKATRDATFLSELDKTIGTNAATNMKERGLNADVALRRLNASIGASSAISQDERTKKMQEIVRTLSGQAGILKSTKAGKVAVLLGQLLDQKKATDAEAAQNQALNDIAATKLGISRDALNATISNNKAKNKIARKSNQIKIQGLELTRRKNESTAAYQRRVNQIRQSGLELTAQRDAVNAANARTKAQNTQAKTEKGYSGAATWLATQKPPKNVSSAILSLARTFPPEWKGSKEATRNLTPLQAIRMNAAYKNLTPAQKNLFRAFYDKAYPRAGT